MSLSQAEITALDKQFTDLDTRLDALTKNTEVSTDAKALIKDKISALKSSYELAKSSTNVTFAQIQSDIRKTKFEILKEEYRKTLTTYTFFVIGLAGAITLFALYTKKKIQ